MEFLITLKVQKCRNGLYHNGAIIIATISFIVIINGSGNLLLFKVYYYNQTT